MLRMLIAAALFLGAAPALAQQDGSQPQMERVPDRPAGEGQGPFGTLLIKNATMIDGTGAPPEGPVSILIEGNRIARIIRGGGEVAADRVIDASGMHVLPGFVDVHGHNGDPSKAPQPSYGFKLWLAHGVTSVRGVGFGGGADDPSLDQRARSAANTITAPRLFAYAVPGDVWPNGAVRTPEQGRAWVRWIKQRGYDGIKFFNMEDPATFAAINDEAEKLGLGTVAHLGQRGVAQVNGRTAVELGLDGVTHFYGHMESLLADGSTPHYPADYNYLDEQSRFAWVARLEDQAVEPGSEKWDEYVDFLVDSGVTLSPTFNIYAASRDVSAARNREWHDAYTLPSLMDFYAPSLTNHGSYYHDWTSEDEAAWKRFYAKWFALTRDFQDKGGRVTAGSDPGYIYQTWGFAYISELEMLREAGLSPMEVIQAATINGAREIYDPKGSEPPFGSIKEGKLADLVIVPGNPLANLKVLYGTGHVRLNRESNTLETQGGVRWTIKDGVVYDARALLADVAEMVEAQKAAR
ncbi:Amidohydrolase family protein [Altererythrobacter xiamenensis]|uniref:Amidohydrolase family protein n=1 Tax=Altererythrobacter xiamenensis TaxID=1316679 RepID=A0A1Y6FH53_9SPHN|nr:amidohydrolase family protein [Altererythrobacter xiamenensis]SMQ73726.1 Amidohydrolase family protein [Altererythrobacter xiamenensis]